ncbi:Major facilitator superfamily domain-containing protein 1 [Fukomys damarensis]|uniref:Major facilitator superfamily domain-containing protein 1 n=1 Tax=Fukomys damarensis TaxID=885580 RepID=A0A091DAJ7_FUKDA|nr:Major facilitator superfamily domain-containing protein 1 [Fukomys damarensis]
MEEEEEEEARALLAGGPDEARSGIPAASRALSALRDPTRLAHRLLVLLLMCFFGFGSYFCSDNPAALQTQILWIKETRKAVRDSDCGLEKMAVGHHIHDHAHVTKKSKNKKTGAEEFSQEFINMSESCTATAPTADYATRPEPARGATEHMPVTPPNPDTQQESIITNEDLTTMTIRELTWYACGLKLPLDEYAKLKQRRGTLLNCGYSATGCNKQRKE